MTKLLIGLEQQGHIYTIQTMLKEYKTWDEINKQIGWAGGAANKEYIRYLESQLATYKAEVEGLRKDFLSQCDATGSALGTIDKLNMQLESKVNRITCGEGKIAVHSGMLDDLPCLSIGNNGKGEVGAEVEGGEMPPEVEIFNVSFLNVESVDVWIEKLSEVRESVKALNNKGSNP